MDETYSPRTVALVALGSLLTGFVLVFGLGMWVLRPRSVDTGAVPPPPEPPASPVAVERPRRDADASAPSEEEDASTQGASAGSPSAGSSEEDAGSAEGGAAPSSGGTVTLSPASISRCFDGLAPTPLPGPSCGGLPAFDEHVRSRSEQIAGCAHGAHGHLALYLDFRFSTSFVRGWGLPSSNVPNAGVVANCVRGVLSPIPFGNIQHAHDRYIVVLGMDF